MTGNFHFRMMALCHKVRDFFSRPAKALEEAGIRPGHRVLDFGCGAGSYSLAAAKMVGEGGKVYALDIHPLALRTVARKAARKRLANLRTIQGDGGSALKDASIDVVLLYDVFHDLAEPDAVLREIHRVLKPGGVLSFSDHHMKEEDVPPKVTGSGLFRLDERGEKTCSFSRWPGDANRS